MPEESKPQIDIEPLIAKALPTVSAFSNYVTVTLQSSEFYLDFYTLEPTPGNTKQPMMKHVIRIIMPIFITKGLVTALANTIIRHQAKNGVLPELREPNPLDVIKVWDVLDKAVKRLVNSK